MTLPNDYQRYAQECLGLAAQAETQKDREQLFEMARAWSHVALAHRDAIRQATFDLADAIKPHFDEIPSTNLHS
jgi:hypothetical protein